MIELLPQTGGYAVGECVWLPDQNKNLLTIGNQTFLKSGSLIIDDAANYPVAFANFAVQRNSKPWNWVHIGWDESLADYGVYRIRYNSVNATWVVYFGNGVVGSTTDLLNFTFSSTLGWTNCDGLEVIAGLFYALVTDTAGGTSQSKVYTSPDGITWTLKYTATAGIRYTQMTVNNGYIICIRATAAAANILYAVGNGNFSTNTGTVMNMSALSGGGTRTNVVVSGVSNTGVPSVLTGAPPFSAGTWTANTALSNLLASFEVITDCGIYDGSAVYVTNQGKIINGAAVVASFPGEVFNCLNYVNGEYVASGSSIYTSSNAFDWVKRDTAVGSQYPYLSMASDGINQCMGVTALDCAINISKPSIGIANYTTDDGAVLYMRVK